MFYPPTLPHEFRKILVRRIPLMPELHQTLTESLVLIVANILTDFLVPIPHGRENESLIRSQMSFFAKDNPTVEVRGITTNRGASTFGTNRHSGNGFHNLMPILFKNGTHFPADPIRKPRSNIADNGQPLSSKIRTFQYFLSTIRISLIRIATVFPQNGQGSFG